MKMMHGSVLLALFEKVPDSTGPHTNEHLDKIEPLMLKNGTFASPAIALARKSLALPGAPSREPPSGIRPPSF